MDTILKKVDSKISQIEFGGIQVLENSLIKIQEELTEKVNDLSQIARIIQEMNNLQQEVLNAKSYLKVIKEDVSYIRKTVEDLTTSTSEESGNSSLPEISSRKGTFMPTGDQTSKTVPMGNSNSQKELKEKTVQFGFQEEKKKVQFGSETFSSSLKKKELYLQYKSAVKLAYSLKNSETLFRHDKEGIFSRFVCSGGDPKIIHELFIHGFIGILALSNSFEEIYEFEPEFRKIVQKQPRGTRLKVFSISPEIQEDSSYEGFFLIVKEKNFPLTFNLKESDGKVPAVTTSWMSFRRAMGTKVVFEEAKKFLSKKFKVIDYADGKYMFIQAQHQTTEEDETLSEVISDIFRGKFPGSSDTKEKVKQILSK